GKCVPTAQTREVEFDVKDSSTNAYIYGATVQFKQDGVIKATADTSQGGNAYATLNVGQSYTVTVTKSGYETKTSVAQTVPEGLGRYDMGGLSLTPISTTDTRDIIIHVVRENNFALEEASVKIEKLENGNYVYVETKTTGDNGKTPTIILRENSQYKFTITKNGYGSLTKSVTIPAGDSAYTYGPYSLTATGSFVSLSVKDEFTEEYIGGAIVKFRKDSTNGIISSTTITDSNGETTSGNLETGHVYYLEISKEDYETETFNIGMVSVGTSDKGVYTLNSALYSECEDSDSNLGGYQDSEKLTPGHITNSDGEIFKDHCQSPSHVVETYCREDGIQSATQTISCGEGYYCDENSNGEGYCKERDEEGEPNDDFEYASLKDSLQSLTAKINNMNDVDVFKINRVFSVGEKIKLEASPISNTEADITAAVFDEDEDVLYANDDRSFYGGLRDPFIEFTLRENHDYLYFAIANSPRSKVSDYDYLSTASFSNIGERDVDENLQRILLDFDGARGIRIAQRPAVDVPRLQDSIFLNEEYPGQIDEIKNLIVEKVKESYADYNVEIYTTDGEIPTTPYTTVYFGTYDPKSLGVSDNIDAFNLAKKQNAIVFIETFGAFESLNPSVEEITYAISNTASHEIGHLLGLYHTKDPTDIMDITATFTQTMRRQEFKRAPLLDDSAGFPIGYQNSPKTLERNVGRRGG
ncbi:matrixin family metalloprotease, partial [Candidatus Pacearchaeota archaeon]|nr:matrixin family metalloprotease [Candidatus Pacearchaeota archaeon]